MIIKTRYRDIPTAVFLECIKPEYHDRIEPGGWDARRGKPVEIINQPEQPSYMWSCRGPVFRVVPGDGTAVCTHIAEIGD